MQPSQSFQSALAFSLAWLLASLVFLLLGGGQLAVSMAVATPVGFAVSWWIRSRADERNHPG